jgi:hypothetical protein
MLDRSEVGATHAARFTSVGLNWILQGRLANLPTLRIPNLDYEGLNTSVKFGSVAIAVGSCQEQAGSSDLLSRAGFARDVGSHRFFNRAAGKSFAQHYQRVVAVDHLVQAGAGEVGSVRHRNPPETLSADNAS